MTTPTTIPTPPPAAASNAVDAECMSHYLALRHLSYPEMGWTPEVRPRYPLPDSAQGTPVGSSHDLLGALAALVPTGSGVGLLLSGGIDSAILAALVPPETPCFTIVFDTPGALDESVQAAAYARRWGHPHHIVRCGWSDYETHALALMQAKGSPLHAVEVPLYLAARQAQSMGVSRLVVGNGADSTFGGMDRLLAQDWSFDDFIERYSFVDPHDILAAPQKVTGVFEPYRNATGIDVEAFLREVHGAGIVQAFDNALTLGGVTMAAPYESLRHEGELDIARIRAGEPKYIVQGAFKLVYDTDRALPKVAFARPTDVWFSDWSGPVPRPEFRSDVTERLADISGEGRWLTWCLSQFCGYLDGKVRG